MIQYQKTEGDLKCDHYEAALLRPGSQLDFSSEAPRPESCPGRCEVLTCAAYSARRVAAAAAFARDHDYSQLGSHDAAAGTCVYYKAE